MNNNVRKIDASGMIQYTSEFKSEAEELLSKYDSISRALDDTEGIKGYSQTALQQPRDEVAVIKQQLEDIVNGYFTYLQENVPNMEGLDSLGKSQLAGSLGNLAGDFKNKRSGASGGSGGSTGGSSQAPQQAQAPQVPTATPEKTTVEKAKSDDIDAKLKEIQEKMRQMKDDIRSKEYKNTTGLGDSSGWNKGLSSWENRSGSSNNGSSNGGSNTGRTSYTSDSGSSRANTYTPTTREVPSTGTNFGSGTSGLSSKGSDLGTTLSDKSGLERMSTSDNLENSSLESGEVIDEGDLTSVAPTDLSDDNLELGATDDSLVLEDKKGNNNLLKFAVIGGMLLGSGALAAGLATKQDEEELEEFIENIHENSEIELSEEEIEELKREIVPERVFRNCIYLQGLWVTADGDFTAFYYDNDIFFLGHAIMLSGNVNGELDCDGEVG